MTMKQQYSSINSIQVLRPNECHFPLTYRSFTFSHLAKVWKQLQQYDCSGVNALFLPSGGLWCEPAPSATLALISMMAFVPGWLVTKAGIVQSHHTKTNSRPPTVDKRRRERSRDS